METLSYKCPSCGSPLVYEGASDEMVCNSCGSKFSVHAIKEAEEITRQNEAMEGGSTWKMDAASYSDTEATHAHNYSCSSCGAQLMTDETTVATNCAFCGSPSIMPSQLTAGTKPAYMLPFTITRQQAADLFTAYFKNKRLIPNIFLKTNNAIDEIRQLYAPYWMFECTAEASITYHATKVRTYTSGQYDVTETEQYLLKRNGTLGFKDLPVDASSKLDDAISESIEPFQMEKAVQFSLEKLSGSMTNRADVSPDECKVRADRRIKSSVESAFGKTALGYTTVTTSSSAIHIPEGKSTSVLIPIWLITTKKDGKTYTFAINGQSGELTCDVPYSKSKYFQWLFKLTAFGFLAGSAIVGVLNILGVLK